ncbi:DUF2336 domain-containing protein [Azospirillum rugosum]|uniref:Uncharacterized protein (DUF2336 family) n=1 Tax=Azospirillum rugosum TaxID=416170 RepID=A0ABS4SLI6_9PROT|nr:DUF2336 domain-containing protein [Azospirillum rugosum]MBP2293429.1 uncharacterized protein (DUF2336 family) [Azospirillum rugosum]MDQ0530200.1 uncharacterized protein (DUF2336 family) [Azospirillum rugosum]
MAPRSLTQKDVQRLLAAPDAQARIDTMTNLVRDLEAGDLAENERTLALEILQRFAADAVTAVREAVAWQIHNSRLLTEDLAARLARDVDRVAFPILRHAEKLSEGLLLEILTERRPAKELAIAGRKTLTPAVSDALVRSGNVIVITQLLRNRGAVIAEPTLHDVLDRFGAVATVNEAMAARPDLSAAVLEKLILFVSEEIRTRLIRSNRLNPQLIGKLVQRAREAATLLLLKPLTTGEADVELLARHLLIRGRLTAPLLFRALCAGEIALFNAGMAVRAHLPPENARQLAWDGGPHALKGLFAKAGLSFTLMKPFRIVIAVAKALHYQGGDEGRERFQTEAIATLFDGCGNSDDREVDDLLLQLFDQTSAEVIERAMEQAGLPFSPLGE